MSLIKQLIFIILYTYVIKASQLESLYDSSDTKLKWPPEGQTLSDDPSEWPGHGQQFGKVWPRLKVSYEPYRPEKEDFQRYMDINHPVVFGPGTLRLMTSETGIGVNSEKHLKSALAYLTYLDVKDLESEEQKRVLFRDFISLVKNNPDNTLYYNGYLSRKFKETITIPDFINCKNLRDEVYDTKHVIMPKSHSFPITKNKKLHEFYCQVEGNVEVLFLNKKNFPHWKDIRDKKNSTSGDEFAHLDILHTDFVKYPQLKDIGRFQIAKVTEGQCLYIPAGWMYQINVLDMSHSISMRWNKNIDVTCEKRVGFFTAFGDHLAWPGEGVEKPLERTTDATRVAFHLLADCINRYIFAHEQPVSFETVLDTMKSHMEFIEDLPYWNEECDEMAQRFFNKLDRNGDNRLSAEDLVDIPEENVDIWAQSVTTTKVELSEIGGDLKVDRYMAKANKTLELEKINQEAPMRVINLQNHEKEERDELTQLRNEMMAKKNHPVKDEL